MKFLSRRIIGLLTAFSKRSAKRVSIRRDISISAAHHYRIVIFLLLTALSFSSCTTLAETNPEQDVDFKESSEKESGAKPEGLDNAETEEASRRATKHPHVYDETPSPEGREEETLERSSGAPFPKVPDPKRIDETPPEPLIPTKTTLPRITLPLPQIALSPLPEEHVENSQDAENKKEKSRVSEGAARKEQQEQQKLNEEERPRVQKDGEAEKEEGPATTENQKGTLVYDELLSVREDTVITIPLKREGWVFLSSSKQDSSLEFRGRENTEGKTIFTFFTGAPRVEDLLFQLQNLERGTLERKTIRLRVLSRYEYTEVEAEKEKEKEESPMPNPASTEEAEGDTAEKRYKSAKEYYQQEEYKKALAGFLYTYHMKKSPEIAEKIAELYGILGSHTEALTWLKKNLEEPYPFREKALKGIIDLAIIEERVALLEKYADDFLKIRGFDTAGTTESLVHFYLMRKDYPKAIEALERFFEVPRKKIGLDSLYYLLASIYERPGEMRNIKKAREYYAIVYDEYPLSSYWTAAKEKINYIDRYYLKIR